MTSYIRDRNRILVVPNDGEPALFKEHKSINQAKRHSRELQASGHKVSAAKKPVALHTPVESSVVLMREEVA